MKRCFNNVAKVSGDRKNIITYWQRIMGYSCVIEYFTNYKYDNNKYTYKLITSKGVTLTHGRGRSKTECITTLNAKLLSLK